MFLISFSIIENPSSCSSSKVLVTFNRITKIYASEESFKLYQGSTTSGSLVYTQPTIFNNQSYTWNTCLSTGTYTMLLTDSYGDAWSSNSLLSFSYSAYNAIGNYRLLSGSSISFQFSVLYPPFYYPYTNFILLVNQQYLIPPLVADSSSYSVTQGSLPSGLSLNTSNGRITGTPTSVISNCSATITSSSSYSTTSTQLLFTTITNNTMCLGDTIQVTLIRTSKTNSYRESFQIHQGSTSSPIVYTQPSIFDNQQVVWSVCLQKTLHSIKLTTTGTSGWTGGSTLQVLVPYELPRLYTLSSGSSSIVQILASAPTQLSYPGSPFVLQKGYLFSVTPSDNGDSPLFLLYLVHYLLD